MVKSQSEGLMSGALGDKVLWDHAEALKHLGLPLGHDLGVLQREVSVTSRLWQLRRVQGQGVPAGASHHGVGQGGLEGGAGTHSSSPHVARLTPFMAFLFLFSDSRSKAMIIDLLKNLPSLQKQFPGKGDSL